MTVLAAIIAGIAFISPVGQKSAGEMSPCAFAKTIENDKEVKGVVAEVSSLGCFELYVNDKLVTMKEPCGNRIDYLRPGATDNRKRRTMYAYFLDEYWVKDAKAKNVVSAFVAPSWFCDEIGGRKEVKPALGLWLKVVYADGSSKETSTDETWNGSFTTPFIRGEIYGGEIFDARKEQSAAKCAGEGKVEFNKAGEAFEISPLKGALVSVRRDLALKPKEIYVYDGVTGANDATKDAEKIFGKVKKIRSYADGDAITLDKGEKLIIDFGQNSAANPEIVASGANGTELVFKGAEMLNDANGERSRGNDGPAGSLYRENYRKIKDDGALVKYIFKGEGEEKYFPTFTFMGYRYAEVTVTGPVTIKSIVSVPVTSIAKVDERGSIVTGDKGVNQLISNIRWGQYSNYLNMPTDCPQRDERLGWAADTQVFAAAAFRNADVYDFFRKWMDDMRDGQDEHGQFGSVSPWLRWATCGYGRLGWADAGVIVPWTAWKMTGNVRIVEENWEAMCKYLDYQQQHKAIPLDNNCQYGDWVSFEKYEMCSGRALKPGTKGWNDENLLPEADFYFRYLAACYWYWNAQRMSEMAKYTDKTDDVKKFADMAIEAREYILKTFFINDGMLPEFLQDMQTPALFALKFNLVEGKNKEKVIAALRKNFKDHGDCLQTGFLGTSILMDAVTYGMEDPELAYTLLLQHKFPSWLYSVDQGATTIWERWNSYTKEKGFGPVDMNSFNHYAYGAVLDWLYGTAAGIQPRDKGGFVYGVDPIHLAPIPDKRLGFLKATYPTQLGDIVSAWEYKGDKCIWKFTIPDGMNATVCVNGTCARYKSGEYTLEIK